MRNLYKGINYNLPLRCQPWTFFEYDESSKYYDFVKHPELIRTSLEDFLPFDHYESVQNFYALLEWVNGPASPFESNDARLGKILANPLMHLAKTKFMMSGSLGYFFRNLIDNISPDSEFWSQKYFDYEIDQNQYRLTPNDKYLEFIDKSQEILSSIKSQKDSDFIVLFLMQVVYNNCPSNDLHRAGLEFIWEFYVWGDTEMEIFENFSSTVSSMETCLMTLAPEFTNFQN